MDVLIPIASKRKESAVKSGREKNESEKNWNEMRPRGLVDVFLLYTWLEWDHSGQIKYNIFRITMTCFRNVAASARNNRVACAGTARHTPPFVRNVFVHRIEE